MLSDIDPFNPFVIFAVFIVGGILRSALGRLIGSAGDRRRGRSCWRGFSSDRWRLSVIFAIIAFVLTMFGESIASSGGRRRQLVRRLVFGRQQLERAAASAAAAAVSAAAAHRGAGRQHGHQAHRQASCRASLAGTAHFPAGRAGAIERAIKAGEATHSGQVRFVVEGALDGAPLFRDQPARERALDMFSQLRIWDTAHNNGVLIYLLLADRDVEIVADRGIDAKVGAAGWEAICKAMETDFRAGNFAGGVIKGIDAVSRHLATHFPRHGGGSNELPDAPVVM